MRYYTSPRYLALHVLNKAAKCPTVTTVCSGVGPKQHINAPRALIPSSDRHGSNPMPPPSPLPKYVYKIIPDAPPVPLPASLPLSSLDAHDGFIHLSTAAQAPATAARFFSASDKLWLLMVPLERIEGNLKWEEMGSGCFAHLYGADLGRMEVESVGAFTRGEGDDWSAVLGKDEWLS